MPRKSNKNSNSNFIQKKAKELAYTIKYYGIKEVEKRINDKALFSYSGESPVAKYLWDNYKDFILSLSKTI